MTNGFVLYGKLIGVSIRAQMQYRTAFLLMFLGTFLTCVIEAVGIVALFDRFGNLGIWTLGHVAFLFGTVNIAFAMVDMFARGFDTFGSALIRTGQFDRVLLRPMNSVLQIAARDLPLQKLGRFTQGVLVLSYAFWSLDLAWSIKDVLLYLFAISSMVAFFYGIQIIRATLCFWTIESLEIVNTLSHGGQETAQYPFSIYAEGFRHFFTYVIPLACVSYFPLVGVMGIDDPLGSSKSFQVLSPFAGFVFLGVCLFFWHIGIRHYRSTGS